MEILSAGWNAILNALGAILAFFYAIVPSYGFAIIGLTVLLRLLLFPLTAKQARSMLAMQRIQPEIKKLQAKYKNDRQRLNEETMAFYKENKINPLAGCLPLLAQMPIFIALFRILRNPFEFIPQGSSLYDSFCGGVSPDSCNPIGLKFLNVDLSLSAQDPHGSFVAALPYLLLVALVGLSGYLQSRQSMRYQTQANAQTQMIGKLMPVIFMFISLSLPAGVVLYFLVSNVWQIGQQEIIFRREGQEPVAAPGGSRERKSAGRATPPRTPEAERRPRTQERPPRPRRPRRRRPRRRRRPPKPRRRDRKRRGPRRARSGPRPGRAPLEAAGVAR
ncbi:MAG: YidC/Oxa1 family membrane protein insertase [Acidimicrobiia bacterium]|nr:YidC/Oxa1 family membrane protein insertase [Acidimicrobiia bacterium]